MKNDIVKTETSISLVLVFFRILIVFLNLFIGIDSSQNFRHIPEYKSRIFDETYNVRLNSGVTTKISFLTVLSQSLKASLKDSLKIISDNDYSWKRKLYWLVINPLFHLEKWRGIRLANHVNISENNSKYSLERSKSKGE